MKLIRREEDCINHSKNFEKIFSINNFPIFMGTVRSPINKDLKANMEWGINKTTGMIQLLKLIPLDVLYKHSHTPGTVGNIWKRHHRAFGNFILSKNPKNIIEIGGSDASLANDILKKKKIKWTIIDPSAKNINKNNNIKIIKKFFDSNSKFSFKNCDIVHSHTFEHIYDPHEFMRLLSKKIHKGSKMFFSVPNIKEMLKRYYTNALNFEHTFYLNEKVINFFLMTYGFKINRKEYFMSDHSIFYETTKMNIINKVNFKNQYKENKLLFNKFINHYKKEIKKINSLMHKVNGPVYLFGAHIFSQFLLSFGLKQKSIKFILDNDKYKSNRRLYGTNLIVKSPQILKKQFKPTVILRAGVYNSEIKKDILNNINKDTNFI